MPKKYTFQFERDAEAKFKSVLSRLDPSEYTVIEDVHIVPDKDGTIDNRYGMRETVLEMEEDCALTFRLGMKNVKIRRERTEEELAEEAEIKERNTVKITVIVPKDE